MICMLVVFFFFSSRRRHTRFDCDWSSDVCSSDLDVLRTDTGAAIAAFDELFHNIDRNLGNVLFHGKGSCIPIDHEQIFAVQNWIAGEIQQLAGNGDSLRALNRAHTGKKLSTSDWTRVRDTMVACSQHHKGALGECRVQVLELLTTLFKGDRKSTRLNSSHSQISYAVFCLKKKKKNKLSTY